MEFDGETIINGSFLATDDYAYDQFAGFTKPSQLIHGMDPENGITHRMWAHVRNESKYKEKPSRYNIPGLQDIGAN